MLYVYTQYTEGHINPLGTTRMSSSMVSSVWSSMQGNSAELTCVYCKALHHFRVPACA